MAGPNPVNPNPISHRSFEANLQHVGGQRQVAGRRQEPQEALDQVELSLGGQVGQARKDEENAVHVGALQGAARDEGDEPLLLPAPENRVAGLLPPPKDEGQGGALVPYQEHLPVAVRPAANLPVPVSQPGSEIIDAEWEPVYPGTPEQGLSPYVPGGMAAAGGPPPPPDGAPPPAGGSAAQQASNMQQFQQEQQEIQKILMQMAADRQMWMAEMWKILQDTQTKIYEIMEQAILYRAQVHDKICAAWDSVIRGE